MSKVEVFDCPQGSPEWFKCRLGIPTASEFSSILAGGAGKTRKTYMLKLLGELLTGEPAGNFTNVHTERGKEMEVAARSFYEMLSPERITTVGFIRRGDAGCSPDALVGDTGMLEIKTKLPHLQLECLFKDEIPSEHRAQTQGQLWVSGRQWVDFLSYWPDLPVLLKRVERDEEYIEALAKAVQEFNEELAELAKKVSDGKTPHELLAQHTKLPLVVDPLKEFASLD